MTDAKYSDEEFSEIISTPAGVISMLREYDKWRKGEGEYEWNEEPSENKDLPISGRQMGMLIGRAIELISGMCNLTPGSTAVSGS